MSGKPLLEQPRLDVTNASLYLLMSNDFLLRGSKVVTALRKFNSGWAQGSYDNCINCCDEYTIKKGFFVNDKNEWFCFDCWFKECFGSLPEEEK